MKLKFTIFVILAVFADFQSKVNAKPLTENEEEDLKEQLLDILFHAEDRFSKEAQKLSIKISTDADQFIAQVDQMVQKSLLAMEAIRKQTHNPGFFCDVPINDIINAALSTIRDFQYCAREVSSNAVANKNSLLYEADALLKEIIGARHVNQKLQDKIADFDNRSSQFTQYIPKLERCTNESSLPQLQHQISENLSKYEQCILKK